tara:strand:+ start:2799 stop:3137 length:339 start_codon:yes stop_codon:yes gene_type:complete
MANLQKHRAHESLNTDTAAVWDVITNVTDANASGGAVLNIDVSGYHTLGLTPAAEIYIHFHNTSTVTLDEDDALKLASGLSFLKIPKGLGKTIYFNYVATGASTVEVRVVKM